MIDELTLGVCLVSNTRRKSNEIINFLESNRYPQDKLYTTKELAWIKIASILGINLPSYSNLNPETNGNLQVEYLKYIWSRTLSEMIELFGLEKFLEYSPLYPNVSTLENQCKIEEPKLDFEKQKIEEARFILHSENVLMENIAVYLMKKYPGEFKKTSSPSDVAMQLSVIIFSTFATKNNLIKIPFIDIESSIAADIHTDKQRPSKENDTYDKSHASAALPYCDYFFTEKNLESIINKRKKPLSLVYDCKTISSPNEVLSILQSI
ncbi:MAG: hypothetical protein IPO40_22300 [Fibrobacteres bacterium]|nr:hypothetical protein [Fibrobacterota bacterium]